MSYVQLADFLAVVHLLWVAFVFFGLVLTLIGGALGWKWVSNRWFRGIHLAMITLVVLRASVLRDCPISTWERDLRVAAGNVDEDGNVTYEGSPIGKFCHDVIHPPTPENLLWIYPVIYAIFGLLIVGTFWLVPVQWHPNAEAQPVATVPRGAPAS
jgi:hypothetical protein